MEKNTIRILLFLLVLLVSFLITIVRSRFHLDLESMWFMVGAIVGVGFLPAVDRFFPPDTTPATRSILFVLGFCAVSLFVVTSATGTFAQGLVVALGLSLLLAQIEEYGKTGHLASWYKLLASVPTIRTQQNILWGYGIFMGALTILLLLRGIV